MADLPNINTSNIGFIAYWSAINDGGVSSINASEALSDPNIQSYTLYDNGWEAVYSSTTGRNITVRVKQDGWFVAYIDRTNTFTQSASSKPNGYYDIINNWTNSGSNISAFPVNTLERAIHSLQGGLSNSGSITYNSSDVGLYNYGYPSTSTVTEMGTQTGGSATSGFIYTSGVTLLYVSGQAVGGNVSFEGTTIENNGNPSSLDILSSGLIPNSGTEYDMSLSSGNANGSILVLWN